jgi:hypothetical protein
MKNFVVTLLDFKFEKCIKFSFKSNKQKKLYKEISVFAGILKANDENRRIRSQDRDPDPLV